MKSINRLLVAATLLTFASSAQALVQNISMSVTHSANVGFDIATTSYTGLFDLTLSPNNYNTGTDFINSASASFSFLDSTSSRYNIDINLGSANFQNQSNISANITLGGSILGTALLDLRADGKLNYTITSTRYQQNNNFSFNSGGYGGNENNNWDFYLDSAVLNANVTRTTNDAPPARTPDAGSTLVLLGSALAALGFVARRRKS